MSAVYQVSTHVSLLTDLRSTMISSLAKTRIDNLIDEVFNAAHERAHGVAATIWQSIVEDGFGAGGQAIRAEIASEISDRVAAQGEGMLDNTREIKNRITEVLMTKINDKVEEGLCMPLRAWASR
ncbi:hypothetical protein KCU64_g7166, partial [Aureobasidium melanogenum]